MGWLAFPLLDTISPKTGALGRVPVLGSELEDSHFRKKKLLKQGTLSPSHGEAQERDKCNLPTFV